LAKWQVELTGHIFDLGDLPLLLTAPGFRVTGEDGRHFLEADHFEALTDSGAVFAAALALLPRINGVGKLNDPSFQDVGVGTIREIGSEGDQRHHTVALAGTIEIRTKVDDVPLVVELRAVS
jgi:hypothetical protein